MNIYAGNLAYDLSDEDLGNAFAEYGEVSSANIITDRETGRSKGFGFVEMPNDDEGEKAIEELDGKPLNGRNLKVNKARPKNDRPRKSW
jgi:RNA recognition motif-containing protein